MTSDPNENAPRSKLPLFIAGMFALVAAGIGTCAAIFLMPKGERVGAIDLTSTHRITVRLEEGSTLYFRIDVTVAIPAGGRSGRAARNGVYDMLGRTHVSIANADANVVRTAVCMAYDGRFVSASDTETEVSVHGIPITCTFTDVAAGEHTLWAQAAWPSGTRVTAATLEVREARAD